jgi:hypothetical protein
MGPPNRIPSTDAEPTESTTPAESSSSVTPPSASRSSSGLPSWAIFAIVVGIAIAVVWPAVFGVYIDPRFDHNTKVTIPPENETTIPGVTPAAVNMSATAILTGTAAADWNLSFCAPATRAPNTNWTCAFTLREIDAPQYYCQQPKTIDTVTVSGAIKAWLIPAAPVEVCLGASVGFAVGIEVPTDGTTTLDVQVIIDSF